MPGFGRHPRVLAAGMAIPALLVAVTACGSTTSATSPGSGSGPGSASAYFNCLREHGVTPGGFGSGAGSSPGSGSSSAASAARQACASLRPSGGFGGFGGGVFAAALQKFESCLKSHGMTLPSSSSPGGFRGLLSELRSGSSADQAAFDDCRSDLPFRGGGGFGGGGSSA